MSKIKYIEVRFGDNDFGWPVERALKRLWEWINKNNRHLVPDTYMGEIYSQLHKVGVLQSLIERLYVLEYLASRVEFKTRGLYYDYDSRPHPKTGYKPEVDWKEKIIKDAGKVKYENTYLSIDIYLHHNKRFASKWQNGERAFLDILKGEVNTF